MAKTIAEMSGYCDLLNERIESARVAIADLNGLLRESQKEIETLRNDNTALRTELALHVKQSEKWDNRMWTILGLFIGSLLALAGSLIVNAIKR